MKRTLVAVACAGCWALLVGCESQQMNMDMMQPMPRAADLDRLDSFVGRWEESFEFSMPGEDKPMKGTGVTEMSWACDKRVLMSHMDSTMGEDKFSGVGMWAWDAEAKKFRTFWADSMGESGDGSAWYDEQARLWRMSSDHGDGTMKMLDANTLEWNWTEYTPGLFRQKMMEMKGTSKRS